VRFELTVHAAGAPAPLAARSKLVVREWVLTLHGTGTRTPPSPR